jgi:TIR domain
MSYVAGFKHDIFISYAHFDNEEDSQSIRWVSRFQADLKSALRQRLGVDPEIFFDTRDFGAHSHLDFLLENVRQSAAFLAVFSPSYVTRDFTIRELEAFAARTTAVHRIVTVELLPVEENRCHPLLRGRKRTPFWWKDASEQDIPLQLTPKFNPEMYHARVQILAHQIKKMLEEFPGWRCARGGRRERNRVAAAFGGPLPAQEIDIARAGDRRPL